MKVKEKFYKYVLKRKCDAAALTLHSVHVQDILDYGFEKAAIMWNIGCYFGYKIDKLYREFPYIEKEAFHNHVKELEEMGIISLVED